MKTIRKLKVVSDRKIRANRENAKKSTGPVTFEGKQKVSGNAITHALTAERLVIIGENLEEFNAFKESMLKIYEPVGAYEEEIFIKIVEIKWKLRRVTSIETGIFGNEILEFDADSSKPKFSDKILGNTFTKNHQNSVNKNQSLIGVAFTKDSNAGSALLKLNTIEGRLISRSQMYEDLLFRTQKKRRKGGKKMKKIHPSKISYYARNKRLFLSNPRYKSILPCQNKANFYKCIF